MGPHDKSHPSKSRCRDSGQLGSFQDQRGVIGVTLAASVHPVWIRGKAESLRAVSTTKQLVRRPGDSRGQASATDYRSHNCATSRPIFRPVVLSGYCGSSESSTQLAVWAMELAGECMAEQDDAALAREDAADFRMRQGLEERAA